MSRPAHPDILAVARVRRFGENTCPASRHTEEIGEHFLQIGGLEMEHAGQSLLATVAALYRTRTHFGRLRLVAEQLARIAPHSDQEAGCPACALETELRAIMAEAVPAGLLELDRPVGRPSSRAEREAG